MRPAAKQAVLLVNLGTPSAPTTRAVREYLLAFLGDPRVVALPAWLWKPLLYTVIVPIRAKRSAKYYQSIWTAQGSPLVVYSKKLAIMVQDRLGEAFNVFLGMRYGEPSVHAVLSSLLQEDSMIESLTILPLYPQYAGATTASCFDVVNTVFKQHRFIRSLSLHCISSYFDNPLYIAALEKVIRHYWLAHGTNAYLLFSFHGLPKQAVKLGDPYEKQCYVTMDLLAKALNLLPEQYQLVLQSRFEKGRDPNWDNTLIFLFSLSLSKQYLHYTIC